MSAAGVRTCALPKKKVLVRGGLFYDSQHIVNAGDGPYEPAEAVHPLGCHPVIAILVYDPDANACNPADETAWKPLGKG